MFFGVLLKYYCFASLAWAWVCPSSSYETHLHAQTCEIFDHMMKSAHFLIQCIDLDFSSRFWNNWSSGASTCSSIHYWGLISATTPILCLKLAWWIDSGLFALAFPTGQGHCRKKVRSFMGQDKGSLMGAAKATCTRKIGLPPFWPNSVMDHNGLCIHILLYFLIPS